MRPYLPTRNADFSKYDLISLELSEIHVHKIGGSSGYDLSDLTLSGTLIDKAYDYWGLMQMRSHQ